RREHPTANLPLIDCRNFDKRQKSGQVSMQERQPVAALIEAQRWPRGESDAAERVVRLPFGD
ncbi:MAG: hypothetical protein PVJ53_12080, partial [Desulfobacterales bacterium]